MKKLLIVLSVIFVSVMGWAQLNPYAYGLSSNWNATTQTLTVNFKLNAKTSKKVIIYAVDPNNKNTKYKIHEIASPGEKLDFSENIHIIGKLWGSDACLPVNKDLTFAVEVSGERTTPGTPIYTANRPFSPHGVAVNNCQDSQDFGAVYVTECTNGVSGNATWEWLSNKGRSLLKYSPQLKYEDFYRKSSDFSLRNGTTLLEPHRVVVSDDGRIFVSSNNMQDKDGNPIVWEFDPQTRAFTTIVKHNSSYGHRVVAIDVKGSGNDIKMLVCYLRISSGNYGYHVYEYSIGAKETIATVVGEKCQYVPMGDNNYYQNTLVNCCNNKWFHYSDGFMDVAYGAEDPTTVFMGLDFFINKANNRVALVYFNAALPQEDRYTYLNSDIVGRPDGHHAGGGGLVTYLDHNGNERIAMGRCQTANSQESDGRIQLYALSGNALTDQKCPITTNTRSIINDLAIDCANNLYAVSFTDAVNSTATGTGTLLAVPMPYSGTVTTYCPSSNAPANKYFKLPARTTLNMNTMDQEELDRVVSNNSDKCDCDITLSRPMQGDMFNTICLPFDLDLSKVSSLQNAELKEFSGARLETPDNDEQILTLTFTDVSPKKIIAYKPYLIKPASTISGSIEINDIRMVKSSGDQTVEKDIEGTTNSISFIPVVTTQNVTPRLEGNESLTFMLVADNRLAMLTSGGVMPGFHAYFEFASAPPKGAKARISTSENTTTDAEVIIDGQTINVEKYLREGRVYIRMGETLYTITGEIVE